MNPSQKIYVLAVGSLLAASIVCLLSVVERLMSAVFNFWRFSGFQNSAGIDVGANISVFYLAVCMAGIACCWWLSSQFAKQRTRFLARLVRAAGVLYFASGTMLTGLIWTGLAFLNCGR